MAKKLGDILLDSKLITPDQLDEATEIQCLYGGKLGTSLIELGAIDEDTLGHVLSKLLRLPYFKPSLLMEVSPDIISLVSRQLALKHLAVPCKLQGKRLFLAMAEPRDLSAIDDLSFHLGYSIAPVVVPELRLALALNKFYKRKLSPRFISLGKQLLAGAPQSRTDTQSRNTGANDEISGLQEYKADVLEEDAVRNVEDLETILDIEDILVEPVEEETVQPEQAWPTLDADLGGTASLSDEEYKKLTTPSAAVSQEIEPTPAPQQPAPEPEPEPEPEEIEIPIAPRDFQGFCELLAKAEDRDDIASCLISYVGQEFSAGGIMMIKGDQAMGWQATIGTQPVADFDRFHVSLDQPSVLLTVAESQNYYMGPLPETVHNILLASNFGEDIPETVLLVPLLLRGRLVSVLYVQDQIGTMSAKLADLQRLASKSSMAFEMLVLKNKILMV